MSRTTAAAAIYFNSQISDEHELWLTEQCKYLFRLFLFNIFLARRKNKENLVDDAATS